MSVDTPVQEHPSPDPPRPPAPDGGGDKPRGWRALRRPVLRLHFYAGLLVAPFLLVAAATGLLYATSYQIEKAVYADQLTVDAPRNAGAVPLSQQVDAALKSHPHGELTAVRPASEPGATTRVLLEDPSVRGDSMSLAVFVDPYRARVKGALPSYGDSGALPMRTWIDHLHRDLHLGEAGRFYSEFAASWLWVTALGGVVLWAGRTRKQRRLRGAKGGRRTLALHGTVGVWAAVGLVALSATGLSWSKYAGAHIEALRTSLRGATPAVSTELPGQQHGAHGGAASGGHEGHEGHQGHTGHMGSGADHSGAGEHARDIGPDRVLAVARQQGLTGPVEITPPSGPGSAYSVAQTDKQWPAHLDQIAVSPVNGEVTDRVDFADHPLLAKLTRWGIDAHMGLLFGLANQIALAALAAALIALILLGYRMWWRRRVPPERGAWRDVPLTTLLPLAAAAAAVGWFLPLLGIGLVAFLTVDVLLGLRARRKARGGGAEHDRSGTPPARV
ncbi:PepSY domain-containing protein [Streptomyces sp. ODS28]|uniref:PepSY-associated TM helix domain-containing protein n=1 Tax=Streptomyces sp. ODS28 TaxID=3136688 RepID=UPI0031EF9AB0